MSTVLIFYMLNAGFLILHEIESAFWKEWKLLRLPGSITGFILLHAPIVLFLFFWSHRNIETNFLRYIIGISSGIGGFLPFLVHGVLMKRPDRFNLSISRALMYGNVLVGFATLVLSFHALIVQ